MGFTTAVAPSICGVYRSAAFKYARSIMRSSGFGIAQCVHVPLHQRLKVAGVIV